MLSKLLVNLIRELYSTVLIKCIKVFFILYLVLVILSSISTSAAPNLQTTNNQVVQKETSTISEQIITDELFDNKTVSTLNIGSVTPVTTIVDSVPNSKDILITVAGRNLNGKVINTTSYY